MDIEALAYGEEWAPIFVFRLLRKDRQVDHAIWLGWMAALIGSRLEPDHRCEP